MSIVGIQTAYETYELDRALAASKPGTRISDDVLANPDQVEFYYRGAHGSSLKAIVKWYRGKPLVCPTYTAPEVFEPEVAFFRIKEPWTVKD